MKFNQTFVIEGENNNDFSGRVCSIYKNICAFVVKEIPSFTTKAVEIYEKKLTTWEKTASFRSEDNLFGIEIRIYENTLIIANPTFSGNKGKIQIYEKNILGEWKLTGEIVGENTGDALGIGADIYQNYIIAGASTFDSNRGKIYIYKKVKNNWELNFTFQGENIGDFIGGVVIINENYFAFNSKFFENDRGKIYLFEKDKDSWKLKSTTLGFSDSGVFGDSLGISKNVLVAGNIAENKAYIYDITTEGLILNTIFENSDSEYIGDAVSISKNLILINGRDTDDNTIGHNYVLKKEKEKWKQIQFIQLQNGLTVVKQITLYDDSLIIGDFNFDTKGRVIIYDYN